MPKVKNMLQNIPRLRKGKEFFYFGYKMHKIMEIICFSANVHQCNVDFLVVLCKYMFVLNIFHLLSYFLFAGRSSG